MATDAVTTTRTRHIATAKLTRPGTQNQLDGEMRAALRDAIAALGDDDSLRAIVITAEGPTFATGIEPPPPAGEASVMSLIAALTKPTVAYVQGDCLDIGLELALACDVRFAGPGARFGITHVQHGLLPWDGGTQRLARAVGRGHAMHLLLTGETIDASEALRIGLIQRIATLKEATAWADRVATAAPIAAAYAKEATNAGLDLTVDQGLRLEADLSVLLQSTSDRAEGLASFREKRMPDFKGQ